MSYFTRSAAQRCSLFVLVGVWFVVCACVVSWLPASRHSLRACVVFLVPVVLLGLLWLSVLFCQVCRTFYAAVPFRFARHSSFTFHRSLVEVSASRVLCPSRGGFCCPAGCSLFLSCLAFPCLPACAVCLRLFGSLGLMCRFGLSSFSLVAVSSILSADVLLSSFVCAPLRLRVFGPFFPLWPLHSFRFVLPVCKRRVLCHTPRWRVPFPCPILRLRCVFVPVLCVRGLLASVRSGVLPVAVKSHACSRVWRFDGLCVCVAASHSLSYASVTYSVCVFTWCPLFWTVSSLGTACVPFLDPCLLLSACAGPVPSSCAACPFSPFVVRVLLCVLCARFACRCASLSCGVLCPAPECWCYARRARVRPVASGFQQAGCRPLSTPLCSSLASSLPFRSARRASSPRPAAFLKGALRDCVWRRDALVGRGEDGGGA
ncbi:hypothetical protein TRVL_06325 [Trypanosoma vivax]|nr:hypothetical protein TRVL_06325 [Trypanosoma vivax]